MRAKVVVVTGSAGFIGRAVVERMESAGMAIVKLHRTPEDVPQWIEQCREADAVVHLAAPTHDVTEDDAQVALLQTSALLDALPKRPLRFVLVSSLALYRPPGNGASLERDSEVYDAEEILRQDVYTRMKAEQEALVRAVCAARGWQLVVLRPSNVWAHERWMQPCVGPFVGKLWLVIAPSRKLRLTHLTNCSRALVAALEAPIDSDIAIPIDDQASVSAWQFAVDIVNCRPRGYLPIPVPGWIFDTTAGIASTIFKILRPGRRLPGLLIAKRRAARFGTFTVAATAATSGLALIPDLQPYALNRNSA